MLFGGLGKPTDDALRAVGPNIVNASFASNAADCPAHAALSLAFEDQRVGGMAKNLGSLWHVYMEHFFKDPSKIEDALFDFSAELNAKCERFNNETFMGEFEKYYRDWFEPTRLLFEQRYEAGAFPGRVLAVEQEFWLVIGTPKNNDRNTLAMPSYMILGRFDGILDVDDKLVVQDWKTIDPKEDLPVWVEHRQITAQHNFYLMALGMLSNERATLNMEEENILLEAPDFGDWPEEIGGWQYNFVRRATFPKRATKDFTLEERIDNWTDSQFATVNMEFDQAEAFMQTVGYLKMNQAVFPFDPAFPLRNPKACRRWGKVRCNMWDPCINGVDPYQVSYLEPAESYVIDALDRVEMLLDEDDGRE
jgi:hypothetical protein